MVVRQVSNRHTFFFLSFFVVLLKLRGLASVIDCDYARLLSPAWNVHGRQLLPQLLPSVSEAVDMCCACWRSFLFC
jgi:hypothetical protein